MWVLPPGETPGARDVGVDDVLMMYFDYYCTGLSANSHEVFSTCINVY